MSRAECQAAPIVWREGEPPRSRVFDDLYYSRDDGLAEARQVFLAGCGLPEAWRGRGEFCVGELGFGTGLNIAALLELWTRQRPPGGHLSIFSIEAFPISAEDAARAISRWPELTPFAADLIERWPGRRRGFHRIDLPQFHAAIDLAVLEAGEALRAWTGRADAWFLDGFAPARNPDMWRPEVLGLVAKRCAPGARLGTYTVAGQVRRDLAAAGFAVERQAGFGAKRQRLEARWPGRASGAPRSPRVAIIGAGIAAASLARAFAALGVQAPGFDSGGPMASGGPAALVTPRLDAGLGPAAALFAQALARAGDLYGAHQDAVIARGALQLAIGPKDEARFAAIAGSDLFEPGAMRRLSAADSSTLAGETAPPGLYVENALVIDPSLVLDAWRVNRAGAAVAGVIHDGAAWRLLDESGGLIAEVDTVCVAAGMASAALIPGLQLRPVRGQASLAPGVEAPVTTIFGGYVTSAPGGAMFGATHDRDEVSLEPRGEDHHRNLAALTSVLPALAGRIAVRTLEAWVGVRATTSDYLPLAGPAPDAPAGLFVLSGLGSRGFTLAPLLAEHVAATALGRPSPVPADVAALIDPGRFAARDRRRGRPAVK